MGFSENQKKMVAAAHHHSIVDPGNFDSFCRGFSNRAVYLYNFLKLMNRNNSLEVILAITGGLIIFYLIWDVKILLFVAIILLTIGLLSPYVTQKIAWAWYGLSKVLAFFSNFILLTLVFYLLLTPLAIIRKIITGKKTTVKESYFISRNHVYSKENFERPF